MPHQKYQVELSDGRKFIVEADGPPSEADILAHLDEQKTTGLTDPKTGAEYKPGTMVGLPPKGAQVMGQDPQGNYLVQGEGWMQSRKDPSRNPELYRQDNSIAGVPPELAVVSGLGVGRAVASSTGTAATKALAGAKEFATQATPAVKYEVTKTTLEHLGVPTPVAIPIAMAVAGYKKGGSAKTAPAESGGVAQPSRNATLTVKPPPAIATEPAMASPAERTSAPPAPMSTSAPDTTVPAPKPAMSPTAIRSAVGLAAKRANANFTPDELTAADELAMKGAHPVEAVLEIKRRRQAAAPTRENLAAQLAKSPGFMSEDQMNAEIAARVGNRSPRR